MTMYHFFYHDLEGKLRNQSVMSASFEDAFIRLQQIVPEMRRVVFVEFQEPNENPDADIEACIPRPQFDPQAFTMLIVALFLLWGIVFGMIVALCW